MSTNNHFYVFGNYGTLTVEMESGIVIRYEPEPTEEPDYEDIVRFDISSYVMAVKYQIKPGDYADIVDFCFWSSDGRYFQTDSLNSKSNTIESDCLQPHFVNTIH